MEEVIRAGLPELYRGLEVVDAHVFRVTRSANLSIDEDAPDLLQAVQEKLLRRPLGLDFTAEELERAGIREVVSRRSLPLATESLRVRRRKRLRSRSNLNLGVTLYN